MPSDGITRVAVLAPPSCSKFLSYLTGWITVIAWQAVTASSVYLYGSTIQGLVILNHPEYMPQRWQTTLLFYAVCSRIPSIQDSANLLMSGHCLIPLHQYIPRASTPQYRGNRDDHPCLRLLRDPYSACLPWPQTLCVRCVRCIHQLWWLEHSGTIVLCRIRPEHVCLPR